MRKAGVDQEPIAGQGKRRFSTLSFHSLRHSFNSHLAILGVDQKTRQVMTGHATKAANPDLGFGFKPAFATASERIITI